MAICLSALISIMIFPATFLTCAGGVWWSLSIYYKSRTTHGDNSWIDVTIIGFALLSIAWVPLCLIVSSASSFVGYRVAFKALR